MSEITTAATDSDVVGMPPPSADDDRADASRTEEPGQSPDPDAADGDTPADEPSDDSNPNREAARYRQQRNEARREADSLRARVHEYERADIARSTGAPIDEVVGDDEDAMRASAAAYQAKLDDAVHAELQRRGVNPAAPAAGVGSSGAKDLDADGQPTWAKVLQRAHGRDSR